MALIQITTTEKNDATFAKTYLFNTDRIIDFYASSATETTFYYKEIESRKDKTDKYKTTLTKTQFEALFSESLYATRIDLPVLKIWSPSERTFAKTVNLAARDVIKAWDIDTSTSYLEFARGAFRKVKIKVNATIAEIESASSSSVSIA